MPDSKIIFRPWLGIDNVYKGEKQKLLILGESHYHDCKKDHECCESTSDTDRNQLHRNLTISTVKSWIGGSRRSRLSYSVPKLFDCKPNDFWAKVIFYNYLQDFAGPTGRDRPSEKLWADHDSANAGAFQQVLDKHEPDRILVLGKKLWMNLPSKVPPLVYAPEPEARLPLSGDVRSYHPDDRFCYWYGTRRGKRALAMPIMHPAAIQFSSDEWIEPIANWLSFSK